LQEAGERSRDRISFLGLQMKICLVCSHGGHLTEILQLERVLKRYNHFFITYRSRRTHSLTAQKYLTDNIGYNVYFFIRTLFFVFSILKKEKPHVVISTGAEIAIPTFFISKFFRIRTIFIETWCRVENPTLTGRILYFVSDVFLVQWKSLLSKYGRKAKWCGAVI
jgi:UDP-N-acetylglucosamine:LPS N-acetylglucosamine transferase